MIFLKKNSNDFLLIKYEDFIFNLEKNINKLCSFLNLDSNYNLYEISKLIDRSKAYSYKNKKIPIFDRKKMINNHLYDE